MITTPEGYAVLEHDTHISRWVESDKRLDHDRHGIPAITSHIYPGDIVVDGGAFIGDHTIAYLDAVGPEGKVMAFEPNPEAFECLRFNCPKACCYPMALGDYTGIRAMNVLPNAGASYVTQDATGGKIMVPMIELDLFRIHRLDFMKLDLEGFELFALRGARATLSQCQPVMVIELCARHMAKHGLAPDDLFQFLDYMGYKWETLHSGASLADDEGDIICNPKRP